MIWRLLICFSLIEAASAGTTVSGRVIVKGAMTAAAQTEAAGTVVWMERVDGDTARMGAGQHAEVLQKNKTFQPHLLAVQAGTIVDFPNSDPIFHNAFSNYNGQIFDIGLYPPGSNRSVTFRREGVVRVFCNIHSAMSAVIVVVNTPYYTITDEDGSFRMEGLTKGRYRLSFYHERATEQTLRALEREVEVSERALALGDIELSESGYLPVPHLNKYGKPYSAAADASTYPGARQ